MITSLWYGPADPSDANSQEILVTGSKDDCLSVWSLKTDDTGNSLITTLEGHSSWISDVTGSSSQKIYSASNDKSAKVWDYTRKTVSAKSLLLELEKSLTIIILCPFYL